VVEEGNDILLSGLIPGIEVSNTFLKTVETRTAMSSSKIAQMGIARMMSGRLANTSLNRFLKKLILADLTEVYSASQGRRRLLKSRMLSCMQGAWATHTSRTSHAKRRLLFPLCIFVICTF
jgi:hypothetical protein